MLANYHTHTTFCDGQNTAEETVLRAIDLGFCALGFSSHAYTYFDTSYCIKDTNEYISTIAALKEKYSGKIQIYLGVEEDAFSPANRADFDYIIGSCHYICVDGAYYPTDIDYDCLKKCLEVLKGDTLKFAEIYYKNFCSYISKRKPDIVGHFDLITKFDENDIQRFLCDERYWKIAEKYMGEAAKSDCIFEINTGAMAKGHRTLPYPHPRLLHILKKNDGKIILSSDSHSVDTLDYKFCEMREILRDIGFRYVYVLHDNTFKKDYL